jgi:uncharacterized protein (TIGR00730 family)
MTYHADFQLLQGTQDYVSDLWRSIRIWHEFRKGFKALSHVENCVTFFGSAQFNQDNLFCEMAYETAYKMGKAGFSIMTGGGPGIMEAANRGAQDAGALSIGCNIKLPEEQEPNKFTDIDVTFNYFFIRKVMLIKYSKAFVLCPGGFGTMDETFEVANLMYTRKLRNFPMVLMGEEYWQNLRAFIDETMIKYNAIDEKDAHFAHMTDSPEEALDLVRIQGLGQKL